MARSNKGRATILLGGNLNDSHDEMVARDDAAKGEITAFINSLDKEQLSSFRQILVAVALDTDIAWQLDGVASGCQIWKFGLTLNGKATPWTGQDQGHSIDKPVPPGYDNGGPLPTGAIKLPTAEEEANGVQPDPAWYGILNTEQLMELYGVKSDGEFGVVCIKCGYASVSLKDRMLREPKEKGCDGCKHKAAWGG